MKITGRFCLLLIISSVIVLIGWLMLSKATMLGKADYSSPMVQEKQAQQGLPKDPCWFVTLSDKNIAYEMISKRQERLMKGYPEDIPLREAIRIFNEEKRCVSALAPYPSLTEDELIGAIVAGPDNALHGDAQKFQNEVLWKIATQKIMPKGTLLVAITGSRVQESPLRPNGTIRAEGISIVLRLGLENYEYGQILKPEQKFVIRRTYFKVETIK